MNRLWIRNAVDGQGHAIRLLIDKGHICCLEAEQGPITQKALEWDAEGCSILPSLHDHHIHILATLAREYSVDVSTARHVDDIRHLVQAQGHLASEWLRIVGYDEAVAGLPDRYVLQDWVGPRPAKLQDRTGACWILSDAAMAVLADKHLPDGAERDGAGMPTGRFWREDAWLGLHLPRQELNPAAWSRKMASYGVTGLTDAGAQNGPAEAAILSAWRDSGALLQKLVVMGREDLPDRTSFARGPLKIHYDERNMPDFDAYVTRIQTARAQGRRVAAHVVSEAELVLYLAALDAAGGAVAGDRIEHGSVILPDHIPEIAQRGLCVVSNPSFIHDRGDAYRRRHHALQWPNLYRLKSLDDRGISLAAGSDAPYGSDDPWQAMRAARDRLTAQGEALGPDEGVAAERALQLYQCRGLHPDQSPRTLLCGEAADFILCRGSMAEILADLSPQRVEASFADGRPIFNRAEAASTLR